MINFFNVEHTKVPDIRTYLLLQTSKTNNDALDIDNIYNPNLRKT
jgi:hypothetical protein